MDLSPSMTARRGHRLFSRELDRPSRRRVPSPSQGSPRVRTRKADPPMARSKKRKKNDEAEPTQRKASPRPQAQSDLRRETDQRQQRHHRHGRPPVGSWISRRQGSPPAPTGLPQVKRPQHLGGAADSLRATRRYSGRECGRTDAWRRSLRFLGKGSPMKERYDSVRPRGAPSEITHRATPLIASEFGFVTEF